MAIKKTIVFPTVYSTGSTVDTDSNSGQKVLNVAATTNFSTGDRVIINRGGEREEEGIIDTIQADISITLIANLTYTHTAVQADVVEICMASLSEEIEKANYKNMAIFLPSTWQTAKITFVGSYENNGTFNQVVNADDVGESEVASVDASKVISLNGELKEVMAAIPYIKLRSGTKAAPVDQGTGSPEITIVLTR